MCLLAAWRVGVASCGAWRDRFDFKNSFQEIGNDLILALLSSILDLLDLALGLLVRLVLGLFVALGMLQIVSILTRPLTRLAKSYLRLKLLELVLLGVAISFDLLLSLVASFLHSLGSD